MTDNDDSENIPSSPLELLLIEAEKAYKQGARKDAEILFNEILDLDPHHSRAWVGLALIAIHLRYWKLAKTRVKQALNTKPELIGHLIDLPIIAQETDADEKALGYLKKLLLVEPTSLYVYGDIGRVYSDLEQRDKVEEAYLSGLAYHPTSFYVGYPLGVLYLYNERYKEALDILETVFEDAPNNYIQKFYSTIAQAYWFCEKSDYALGYFLELCKLYPENHIYPNWLGYIYFKLGLWEYTYFYSLKVIELKPDYEDGWASLAWACLEGELFEEGIEYALEGLKRFPNNERLLVRRCQFLYELKDYGQSYEVNLDLINRFPETCDFYFFKGMTLNKLDRWDEAKEAFEVVYQTIKKDYFIFCNETLCHIAKLYKVHGEEEEAERFLKKAAEFPVRD